MKTALLITLLKNSIFVVVCEKESVKIGESFLTITLKKNLPCTGLSEIYLTPNRIIQNKHCKRCDAYYKNDIKEK